MGSRSFSVIPMAISLCASFNSAYMILGIPGEIYSHGTQFYIMILGTGLGVFIAAELWLPILYRIQVVSIYEYFELRYKSKFPRILMTLIFILKVWFNFRSSVCSSACSRDSRPRDWSRLGTIFMVSVSQNIPRDSRDWGHLYFTNFLCFCIRNKQFKVAIQYTLRKFNQFMINGDWDQLNFIRIENICLSKYVTKTTFGFQMSN